MVDFQIRKGLSTVLFIEPGVVNPRLVIEEGCWYLCTDTAELFLGTKESGELTLKRINSIQNVEELIDTEAFEELKTEVNQIKENLNNYATKQFVIDTIAEQVSLENLATKEDLEEVKTKLEAELLPVVEETILPTVQKVESEILPTVQELAEKAATQHWVQEQLEDFASVTYVDKKIAAVENPALNITVLCGGDANPADDE